MFTRLAIIAGEGELPRALLRAAPGALFVTFPGYAGEAPEAEQLKARFEHLGALFEGLRAKGVGEVVFAGAMSRPDLDPAAFDAVTRAVMPGLAAAMAGGDDRLLRAVVSLFEAEGFQVRAAHEVAPALLAEPGLARGRAPTPREEADAERAALILAALGPVDVGQSAVVEAGLCLGIETVQGTDAMLRHVAATPAGLRRGSGVFAKTAKQGQDLRIDMPAVGPETVRAVAAAGLAGMVLGAGSTIILEREEVFRLIDGHGLFLIAR
jgi:DUF1009 family protein